MTLLDLKPSTIDVDFTGPLSDIEAFREVVSVLRPGFRVDTWPDGQVFSQFLPPDYLEKSIEIKAPLKLVKLSALNPLDIVATKIGRLDGRDEQDIGACVEKYKLTKKAIRQRAKQIGYAGNEAVYEDNLNSVLKRLSSKGYASTVMR